MVIWRIFEALCNTEGNRGPCDGRFGNHKVNKSSVTTLPKEIYRFGKRNKRKGKGEAAWCGRVRRGEGGECQRRSRGREGEGGVPLAEVDLHAEGP